MLWICFGVVTGLLLYWLFAPREEEVILIVSTGADIAVSNN